MTREDRIVELLESINAKLGAETPSSVELKATAHGPDITVKAYVGSPVQEAGDAALAEWRRLHAELNQAGVDAFGAEVNRRRS